jgi:hypothetical protein
MNLSELDLPQWLVPTLHRLMDLAEAMFDPHTGPAKKRWVKAALLDAASSVDIRKIPNWIEDPTKEALVDFLVEVVWSLHFRRPRSALDRAVWG